VEQCSAELGAKEEPRASHGFTRTHPTHGDRRVHGAMHLQTAKDLRRKGRPTAAHTCTATRREEHERSLEAELNPRVGAVYEVSKRRVPTLEQRRNGIPFMSHGESPPCGPGNGSHTGANTYVH
jgi:hypothetical protein